MARRAAQGAGTIRKKTVKRNGKEYTYWEARITTGRDPGTGKQIQRSFSGKTQKEVREKLQAVAVEVNAGAYVAPQKMTVGQWLDVWASEYLGNRKPGTVISYRNHVYNRIKPALGAIRLSDLHPHYVQKFINEIDDVAPSTIRIVYKVLHMALEKAVSLDYIARNPSDNCILPKAEQAAIKPLDDEQAAAILKHAQGTRIEYLVTIALFSGMRISELLGLTWDSIDQEAGTIAITKQLNAADQREHGIFSTPKSGKSRVITPAKSVMSALNNQQIRQAEMRLRAGSVWSNEYNLVFTLEDGSIMSQQTTRREFDRVRDAAGIDKTVRFHDLRHTYAVNAMRAGDDIKSIQSNLGHSSASFTLDIYGHFTERMKQDSASRMESFINHMFHL